MLGKDNQKPIWVDDEPLLRNILNMFLDKVDKGQSRLSIKINQKTAPELFDFNNNTDYLWSLLKELEEPYGLVSIRLKNTGSTEEEYVGAMLDFCLDREDLVRQWLNRPVVDSYIEEWRRAVEEMDGGFNGNLSVLRENVIRHRIKRADKIVQGFKKMSDMLAKTREKQTLRQLSARCFWGDSKFLEKKEELVDTVFPDYSQLIMPRKILLETSIPDLFKDIVFIENLDTFLCIVENRSKIKSLAETAFVYGAGFKGAASRIRELGNVAFSHVQSAPEKTLSIFLNYWFKSSAADFPTYFWGDLDYSGLGILSGIRKSFSSAAAWEPGYRLMLELAEEGVSHGLAEARKDEQKDPGNTGCKYADDVLLPFMRTHRRFLDQEAVDIRKIK